MGYRLDCCLENDEHISECFGKLYGYVLDERKLKSYQYLKELGKFYQYSEILDKNGDIYYWGYGFYPEIKLAPNEFKTFSNYYIQEFVYYWYDVKEQKQQLENFTKLRDKLLKFNENIILEWG